MSFVNTEAAVYTLLRNAGFNVYLSVPETPVTPAVWIMNVGGNRTNYLAQDRLQISVIDPKHQTSRETAEQVLDLLIDGPYFVPGHGLLDRIQAESSPVEVPYKDQLRSNLFTIAVDTRAL